MIGIEIGLGIAIGLALGLLGGGGSILTVPILVYIVGQDASAAVASSLAIVGANALFGVSMHWKAGHVRLQQALLFGLAGMAGAYVAAGFTQYVSDQLLMTIFALLMLVVAVLMLRPLKVNEATDTPPRSHLWKLLLTGGGVGLVTGFLGVGGGFLIVPALVLVMGMSMVDAVGSSLLIIVMNAIAGLFGHLQHGALDWAVVAIFTVSGLVGVALGTYLSQRWSAQRLRTIFAVMVLMLAVTLLAVNVPQLIG
ncbi:MAG: sulfite exporter TauE/SafE family protein [Chloroflexaceae bacterium]|nr:sulfite exporter TauE/SafE family protein [Chloroflexaceae bacterium]